MDMNTLIPIIIFGTVSIIVIGLIFLLSRKKKPQNQFTLMPITPVNPEIKVEHINKDEEVKEEVKEDKVVEEVKQEEPKEEIKEEKAPEEAPVVKDSFLEELKHKTDLKQEEVEISISKPLVEENKDEEIVIKEPVSINETKEETIEVSPIIDTTPVETVPEEPSQPVEVVDTTPVVETQSVQLETPIIDTTVPQEESTIVQVEAPQETTYINTEPIEAFNQTPIDNHEINTDIQIDNTQEYVGNKTEILNVEEINRAMENKE